MSHNNEDLLKNIKRQAKRLAKLLSCQLGQAQESLAICLYCCDSYSVRVSVKTVSHFGFIRSLHNLLFPQLSFYPN
jgi:hypothetical protein